jgi:hypothetical protein
MKLMTSDFALYQLSTGHLKSKQDTDFVPGPAIVDLLQKYFVPDVFPDGFPFERLVAKLCWFAGQQRSLSNYQAAIHSVIDDDEEFDQLDDDEDAEDAEGAEATSAGAGAGEGGAAAAPPPPSAAAAGEGAPNSSTRSTSNKNNKAKPMVDVKNGGRMFVESLPIKRLLSSFVLMSDCHIERKIKCLELLDRPNILHPQLFEGCPAQDSCVYIHNSGVGPYSEVCPPSRGTCTCPGIATLQSMENLFKRTWSMCFRIHLSLNADDGPWLDQAKSKLNAEKERYDEHWSPVMRRHMWSLSNGVTFCRGDLVDIVEQSAEWKHLEKSFHILPHLYEERNSMISAKERLKYGLKQDDSGGSSSGSSSKLLEARLGIRKPDWSMYKEMNNIDVTNMGVAIRSNDVLSEWKTLLLHGLDTIQRETCETHEHHVVLRASRSWLDALDLSVEFVHVALECATTVLTSPLTVEDLHHASAASMSSSSLQQVRCRERNPWEAIRHDDLTSLTYLLQHGVVDEDTHDPETGLTPLETAVLAGNIRTCYLLLHRVVAPSTAMAAADQDQHSILDDEFGAQCDASDDVLVKNPAVVECSFRSGHLETMKMCSRYQRDLAFVWMRKHRRAIVIRDGGRPEDEEDCAAALHSVACLVLSAHRERWRHDSLNFIYAIHNNKEEEEGGGGGGKGRKRGRERENKVRHNIQRRQRIGRTPLPQPTLHSEIVQKTLLERQKVVVSHAMKLFSANDPYGIDGKKTALTLILMDDSMAMINAILRALLLEGGGTTSVLESVRTRSVHERAPDVYVLFELSKSLTKEKLPTRKEMVQNIGTQWATSLLEEHEEQLPLSTDVLGSFLRPGDHPVPPTEGSRETQKQLLVDRKREIEEWEKEHVKPSEMLEYCEDLTGRCGRLINAKRRKRCTKEEGKGKGKDWGKEKEEEKEKENNTALDLPDDDGESNPCMGDERNEPDIKEVDVWGEWRNETEKTDDPWDCTIQFEK